MKKTINSAVWLLASSLAASTSVVWALDRGEMLANTCVGCHGPQGSSMGPATPSIAAMEVETFVETMKAYQEDRPATIMNRIAKGYTEDELAVMGEYFTKQAFVRHDQPGVDAAKAKAGANLHEDYCEKCHEEGGTKDIDGSSILAGQWLPYLQFQLADFHAGKRDMTKKMRKRMEEMVEKQGKASLDEIAHYYASQK